MNRVFCALLLTLFMCWTVMAAEPKVFSDEDLKGYNSGPTAVMGAEDGDAESDQQEEREKYKADIEKEEWCSRATAAEERIKKAGETATEAAEKKAYAYRRLHVDNYMQAVDAINKAISDMEEAESEIYTARKAKEDLEAEAHQKRIPPGWLRCH